jgi:hypothetical protein
MTTAMAQRRPQYGFIPSDRQRYIARPPDASKQAVHLLCGMTYGWVVRSAIEGEPHNPFRARLHGKQARNHSKPREGFRASTAPCRVPGDTEAYANCETRFAEMHPWHYRLSMQDKRHSPFSFLPSALVTRA